MKYTLFLFILFLFYSHSTYSSECSTNFGKNTSNTKDENLKEQLKVIEDEYGTSALKIAQEELKKIKFVKTQLEMKTIEILEPENLEDLVKIIIDFLHAKERLNIDIYAKQFEKISLVDRYIEISGEAFAIIFAKIIKDYLKRLNTINEDLKNRKNFNENQLNYMQNLKRFYENQLIRIKQLIEMVENFKKKEVDKQQELNKFAKETKYIMRIRTAHIKGEELINKLRSINKQLKNADSNLSKKQLEKLKDDKRIIGYQFNMINNSLIEVQREAFTTELARSF